MVSRFFDIVEFFAQVISQDSVAILKIKKIARHLATLCNPSHQLAQGKRVASFATRLIGPSRLS